MGVSPSRSNVSSGVAVQRRIASSSAWMARAQSARSASAFGMGTSAGCSHQRDGFAQCFAREPASRPP